MRAIITIFSVELEGKNEVKSRLEELAEDVKIVSDACIFSPKPGKLFDLLNLLRDNKILYGTHYNSTDRSNEDDAIKTV